MLQPRIHLRLVLLLLTLASTLFATMSYMALIEKYHDVATINRTTRDELAGSRLKRIDIQLEEARTNLQKSTDAIERLALVNVVAHLDVDRAVEELLLSDYAVTNERLLPMYEYIIVTAPSGPVSQDDRQKLLALVNAYEKLPRTPRDGVRIDLTAVENRDSEIAFWEKALGPFGNRIRLVPPVKMTTSTGWSPQARPRPFPDGGN